MRRAFVILALATALIGCEPTAATPVAPTAGSFHLSDRYVGLTAEEVRAKLGPPFHISVGGYGELIGPDTTDALTYSYEVDGGTQYLMFEQQGDVQKCIASDWIAEGVVF